ncbi:hypothetical protein CFOL_v3_27304 [Cephalotus follicularis]|uniref:Uncharacterized protein n=1 Tax=Cephalotus follicularis TaxID=3775 RepID=A0A1Q3CUD3_CEPFO|nr:hypothetical protein CFOL_v3_27304 [Cephalotus follicularis]
MVAISLYRGNLHKVPDTPRVWLMPSPKMSLKDFKTLLHRRNNALSRLGSTASSSNPNPNSNPQLDASKINNDKRKDLDVQDSPAKVVYKVSGDGDGSLQMVEKPPEPQKHTTETTEKVNVSDKEKRKRVVEEELEVLNAKKHKLVLVLKQILNVEEELKRRNTMQGTAIRPSVPLQVDVTNDSGSMTRHAAQRMGLDGHLSGDLEGGEADDASNLNMHARHMLRMSSMSPSSESPLRRPTYIQLNAVLSQPSRATLGVTSSPSRLAPTGHQGHPGNLPTVSVSGTNYVVSSPSPAASGGTSVFRDARQPSPWN